MNKPIAEREKAAKEAVVLTTMNRYDYERAASVGWTIERVSALYWKQQNACARLAAIQKEKKRGR